MIKLVFSNTWFMVEDEDAANWFLHGQHVGKNQVTKEGDVWTTSKEFKEKVRKNTEPTDPDAKRNW